jgi:hypothetical protein
MTAFFSASRYDLSAKAYYVPNTIGVVPNFPEIFLVIFLENVVLIQAH